MRNIGSGQLERLAKAMEEKSRDEAASMVSAWLVEYLGGKVTTRKA